MSMKQAVVDAIKIANQGQEFHTKVSGPVWENNDTHIKSKLEWSLIRTGASGAPVYWMLGDDSRDDEILTRKVRVSKKGDGTSAVTKESDIAAAGVKVGGADEIPSTNLFV